MLNRILSLLTVDNHLSLVKSRRYLIYTCLPHYIRSFRTGIPPVYGMGLDSCRTW